jgi:hypothetical protein
MPILDNTSGYRAIHFSSPKIKAFYSRFNKTKRSGSSERPDRGHSTAIRVKIKYPSTFSFHSRPIRARKKYHQNSTTIRAPKKEGLLESSPGLLYLVSEN